MPKPVTRTLKAGNRRLQEKMCQYGILNSPVVKFITIVIRGNDVQKKDVLSFGIKTTQSELHLRKHLPRKDKTRSKIQIFPEDFWFQTLQNSSLDENY